VFDAQEGILETDHRRVCCADFDRILLETSGLADPAALARTFFVEEAIRDRLRLDAIVTLVDARHAGEHLAEVDGDGVANETVEQIAFADRVVINKTDLASPGRLRELSTRIRAINALAPIVTAEHAKVDLDLVLGLEAFDLSRVLAGDPQFLQRGGHRHDETITSVGIDLPGEVDPDRAERWLRDLLAERGTDIFRTKAILALAGHDSAWVFQGVHTSLETERGRNRGEGAPRRNRLVFIGRNLDRDELQNGFRSCLTTAR
jgi:G3E family GTPase